MKSLIAITVLALAACSTTPSRTNATATDADLQKFRDLAGTWDADLDQDGENDVTISYAVTANDSAVMERLWEGEPYEMVSMYHLNGDTLMMTHYCAATNQPRLVARKIDDDSIVFSFLDITNLASPDAHHINGAAFEFIDPDHVTATWTSLPSDNGIGPVVFRMTRRK